MERGSFNYRVNREYPLYKMLENVLDDRSEPLLQALIKTLEDTFPYMDVYNYLAGKGADLQPHKLEDSEAYELAVKMISQLEDDEEALKQFINTMQYMDFFIKYPDVIEKIKKEYL